MENISNHNTVWVSTLGGRCNFGSPVRFTKMADFGAVSAVSEAPLKPKIYSGMADPALLGLSALHRHNFGALELAIIREIPWCVCAATPPQRPIPSSGEIWSLWIHASCSLTLAISGFGFFTIFPRMNGLMSPIWHPAFNALPNKRQSVKF